MSGEKPTKRPTKSADAAGGGKSTSHVGVADALRSLNKEQSSVIKSLIDIGIALSAQKDLSALLETIVIEARRFTGADAGTLYLVDDDEENLEFVIVQNKSMDTMMGGITGAPINWPPLPLKRPDGTPNKEMVSAYVAITGETVNIEDVYEVDGFNFEGTKEFDEGTGYRSRSMLVIPMRNHENEIIGVLQLINATDQITGRSVKFPQAVVDITYSLASQAAVAITNVRLIKDLENLFDSFIQTIATAIDEKSPYTAGHISRVANLTMEIAQVVDRVDWGPYADLKLTEDEMTELRLAAWMHDVGKIATPEHVVDKHTKLEKVFDRVEFIALRFEYIKQWAISEWHEKKAQLYADGKATPARLKTLDKKYAEKITLIEEEGQFAVECNTPGEFMENEKIERIEKIAKKTYMINGKRKKYLTADEVANLSIKRGTLNIEDREIIENHAMITLKMLKQLPFNKKQKHVPEYAAAHHEKLDGTGYPLRLKGDEISVQARMMAIADIFEALTAHDRPYKEPMMLSQAIRILRFMVKDNHLDADLVDIFLKEGLAEEYSKEHLSKAQLDWNTKDLEDN